uniref:Phosphatidylinositol-glycan biosynthesis class F protein n=1 Tax=Acrobeloides nanus TaxID=290746 RepID=A0A914BZH1_9BILA
MGYIKSVFCSIATIPVFYITAVLFGAPLLSNFDDTFVFSAVLALFASFPLFYSTNGDFDQLCDIVLDYNFSSKSQYFAHRCAVGSLAGAWLGAIVIPLDWDRWWQKWPIPCLFGIFIGALLGLLVAQIQLYFGWGKASRFKRHFKII